MRSIVAVLLLGVSACVVTGSKEWFAVSSYGDREVRGRASFDLNCPKEKIEFQSLSDSNWYSVAARGCGKKAAYKHVYGAGWVLNSEITPDQ